MSAIGIRFVPRLFFRITAGDPALLESELLGAADLLALAFLDGAHEVAGIEQRGMGAGVEPGIAAANALRL